MKKILFLIILSSVIAARADIVTDAVVLHTMDKITGRVQKMTVAVGDKAKVGSLTVFVEKCLKKPPEETPENAAFLTIMDEDSPEKPTFNGWMFSSNPALSAMEHPVYDIWVVECEGTEKEIRPVIESAPDPVVEEENPNEPIED